MALQGREQKCHLGAGAVAAAAGLVQRRGPLVRRGVVVAPRQLLHALHVVCREKRDTGRGGEAVEGDGQTRCACEWHAHQRWQGYTRGRGGECRDAK